MSINRISTNKQFEQKTNRENDRVYAQPDIYS